MAANKEAAFKRAQALSILYQHGMLPRKGHNKQALTGLIREIGLDCVLNCMVKAATEKSAGNMNALPPPRVKVPYKPTLFNALSGNPLAFVPPADSKTGYIEGLLRVAGGDLRHVLR